MSPTTKATLAGLLGYSIFGFSFLFSKTALDLTTPFVLLSFRFLTAFLVLNLLLFTGLQKISLKGKPVGRLLLMGLIQPVIYFICETYGIALTTSSFAGVVIGLAPVMGLLFGTLFLKRTPLNLNSQTLRSSCFFLCSPYIFDIVRTEAFNPTL